MLAPASLTASTQSVTLGSKFLTQAEENSSLNNSSSHEVRLIALPPFGNSQLRGQNSKLKQKKNLHWIITSLRSVTVGSSSHEVRLIPNSKFLILFMKDILLVGAGSCLGGMLRYIVSQALKNISAYPLATFSVNILGCFLIGLLWSLNSKHTNLPNEISLFLMVGFCGGFTTFKCLI